MNDQLSNERLITGKQEVLKRRSVSEPFVIPWEDGEEFKLTAEYLNGFVTAGEFAKYNKEYFYSYNDQYDINTRTLSFDAYFYKGRHTISWRL